MKKASKKSTLTLGIDLGDKSHEVCVVDAQATVVSRETILNNREAFHALSQKYRGALMIMEAGTHSPWISRQLEAAGHAVIVANVPWSPIEWAPALRHPSLHYGPCLAA